LEYPARRQDREIDDLIANGDPAPKRFGGPCTPEYGEGQILNGEITALAIRRVQPTARPRIVRFIE
jgi:hypothetical protein